MAKDDMFEDVGEEEIVPIEAAFEDIGDDEIIPLETEAETTGLEKVEALGKGALQGATAGFSEEIGAGLRSLLQAPERAKVAQEESELNTQLRDMGFDVVDPDEMKDQNPLESLVGTYRDLRDSARKREQELQEKAGGYYTAGEFAGGAASMLVPGASAIKGSQAGKSLTTLAKLAAPGALAGAGYSEADVTQLDSEEAKELAKDVAVGGTTSALLGTAANKVLGITGKSLKKTANNLAAKAAGLKSSFAKKAGPKKVQSIGNTLLEEEIVTPLANTDEMIAKTDDALRTYGEELTAVKKKLEDEGLGIIDFGKVKDRFYDKVKDKVKNIEGKNLFKKEVDQIKETIDDLSTMAKNQNTISDATSFMQQLGNKAFDETGSTKASREFYKDAYHAIKEVVEETVDNAANKLDDELLKNYKLAKNKYTDLKSVEHLLKGKQATEITRDMMTGGDWLLAGLAAGSEATGPGLGVLAARKGLKSMGGSLGAKTLETLAKGAEKVSKTPKLPQLAKGIAGGSTAVGTDNFVDDFTDLTNKTGDELISAAESLQKSENPIIQAYAKPLKRAADMSTNRERNAILYGLYQQKPFRDLIRKKKEK